MTSKSGESRFQNASRIATSVSSSSEFVLRRTYSAAVWTETSPRASMPEKLIASAPINFATASGVGLKPSSAWPSSMQSTWPATIAQERILGENLDERGDGQRRSWPHLTEGKDSLPGVDAIASKP